MIYRLVTLSISYRHCTILLRRESQRKVGGVGDFDESTPSVKPVYQVVMFKSRDELD